MSCLRQVRNNHGTSIVEVLVVMVVLLVGIMSVVTMFPGGFQAVRHAESMTFADRLAQGEMERWKTMAENLPYGVVAVDANGVINDLNPTPPINDDKAYKIRRIIGETTKIPVGTPYISTGSGMMQASIYTLAYAPIEYAPPPSPHELVVTGGNMRRRVLDLDRDPDAYESLNASQYGIEYELSGGTFKVYFKDFPVGRRYRISYSYWVQDGSNEPELRSEVDQPIVRIDDHTGEVTINSTGVLGLEDYSDSVSREFELLAAGTEWNTSDPYEYQLVNDILGIVAFNPYGYNVLERTSSGMQPLEAHISYSIRDTTIMRDDRRVSQNGRVKLSLNHILKLDDPIEELEPYYHDYKYHGIFGRTDTTGSMDQKALFVIDLETGVEINLTNDVDVDYDAGTITFPQGFVFSAGPQTGIPIAGRNTRILYKADGDWSLQMQKAYEVYRRDYTQQAVDYHTYTVAGAAGHSVNLYFAPCDAGKTVAVDYTYRDVNDVDHKVVGESHQISEIEQTIPVNVKVCKITLDFTDPLKFGDDAADNRLTRIYSVTGTSLKIRVLWKDGSRWRYVDKDTTLLRKSTEV